MPIRRPSILNSLSRNSIVSNNENKSPVDTPPQCKSPTPTGPSLKDTRAFEHDRQRLKKAAALLARKARAQQPPSQSPPTKPKRPGHGGRHGHGVNVDIDNDEPAVEENEVEVGEAMSLSLRLGVDAGLVPTQALQETVAPPLQAEVALTDLLIPRKPRRKD
ncbi:hypothetical protein H0H93_000557 [Arthromyces matolae]|nr:hypothetical protein H0H93_000557 [Arthromyces matolae]